MFWYFDEIIVKDQPCKSYMSNILNKNKNKYFHFEIKSSYLDDLVKCIGEHICQLRKKYHLGDSAHIDIFMFRFDDILR